MNCLRPGLFVHLSTIKCVRLSKAASAVPYVQSAVAKGLQKACGKVGSIQINSALRTLPQQVMLWNCKGRNGVSNIVARPGTSNHESGTAVDLQNAAQARSAMQSSGFKWFGPGDAMHYDWKGGGTANIKSLSVKAFITLYNSRRSSGKLAQSNSFNPAIENAIKASPIGGWPGFKCGSSAPTPAPKPAPAPPPKPSSPPPRPPPPKPVMEPEPEPEPEPEVPQPEPEPEQQEEIPQQPADSEENEPTPDPTSSAEETSIPETETSEVEDLPQAEAAEAPPRRGWTQNLPWNKPRPKPPTPKPKNSGDPLPTRPKDGKKWTDAFALLGEKFEIALDRFRKPKPKQQPKQQEEQQPDDPVVEE